MENARASEEQVILKNGTAEVHSPGATVQQIETAKLLETVRLHSVRGLNVEALPDHCKWRVDYGQMTVMVIELPPELRLIQWLSPKSPVEYGPESTYEPRRLATPYIVLKVPFFKGRIMPRCELFYRNRPLTSLDDELSWCNLLNVSPDSYGCRAWLCTEYLSTELESRGRRKAKLGLVEQLDSLMKHMWGGGFNRSSEVHEGKSCFTQALEEKVDPRVINVDKWQKASVANPRFVLDVKWKSAGLTVGQLLEKEVSSRGQCRNLSETSELVSLLMGTGNGG